MKKTNRLVLFVVLLLLTAAVAFSQNVVGPAGPSDNNAGFVSYSWVQPDCSGQSSDPFAQWASGCYLFKLKITVRPTGYPVGTAPVSGFFVTVNYSLTGWVANNTVTATTFTKDTDGNFAAVFVIGSPMEVGVKSITAQELIVGQTFSTN